MLSAQHRGHPTHHYWHCRHPNNSMAPESPTFTKNKAPKMTTTNHQASWSFHEESQGGPTITTSQRADLFDVAHVFTWPLLFLGKPTSHDMMAMMRQPWWGKGSKTICGDDDKTTTKPDNESCAAKTMTRFLTTAMTRVTTIVTHKIWDQDERWWCYVIEC